MSIENVGVSIESALINARLASLGRLDPGGGTNGKYLVSGSKSSLSVNSHFPRSTESDQA